MVKLENFVMGSWVVGDDDGTPLYNAVNGELIAHAGTKGLDFPANAPILTFSFCGLPMVV